MNEDRDHLIRTNNRRKEMTRHARDEYFALVGIERLAKAFEERAYEIVDKALGSDHAAAIRAIAVERDQTLEYAREHARQDPYQTVELALRSLEIHSDPANTFWRAVQRKASSMLPSMAEQALARLPTHDVWGMFRSYGLYEGDDEVDVPGDLALFLDRSRLEWDDSTVVGWRLPKKEET